MRPVRRSSLPRFDSRDPAVLDDPYAVYRTLRESGPVCRGGSGQWVLSRHADVTGYLADPRLGSEYPLEYHRLSIGDGPAVSFFSRIVLDRDPPAHTRLRRLMHGAFRPAAIRALADRIGGMVDELLAPALDCGHLEVVEDLALPLPVNVVCELIGIPAAERAQIRPHALDLARGFGLIVGEDDRAATHAAVVHLREHVDALVTERIRRPGADLVSRMLEPGPEGDRLERAEVVDNVVFLFFAGFETSIHLMASGVANLLRHPDELARLRADPDLLGTAVDELARFDAPIQWIARVTGEPVEVGGRTVRAGRMLLLLLASANRDERRFPDPDRIDVGRRHNAHLSFGSGIHRCMGLLLARAQASVSLGRLLERCAELEPDGEAVVRPHPNLRGYASVPVGVRAR